MESTTCDVQHNGQQVGVVDGLSPTPTSIKDQMPELAKLLQDLAVNGGRESVQVMLKATMDLRRAYEVDDYAAVCAIYRRGDGWINAQENGFCMGVPDADMKAFAKRHREAAHGTH
jgi:hypothetical protein